MNKNPNTTRRSLGVELAIATTALLVAARALFLARGNAVIGPAISTIVAIGFLYAPIAILWARKRSIDFMDRGWRAYLVSVLVFLIAALIIFPSFMAGAYGWQLIVMGKTKFTSVGFPNFLNVVLFQILLVALPEEFYFRGYFQSAMNKIFAPRWHFLGANLGPGWIVTAFVFAVAHTIVTYQWWHFSIFFPALVFGYLRERTGTITAPILFHAASNLLMDWISRSYV